MFPYSFCRVHDDLDQNTVVFVVGVEEVDLVMNQSKALLAICIGIAPMGR